MEFGSTSDDLMILFLEHLSLFTLVFLILYLQFGDEIIVECIVNILFLVYLL